ncbi:gliding motility lipoprotein GldD [Robertkochia sediminum]|uniref:gliding motility lipoprotein GldD n=1 Tax=Robertkochia sediminum TaxID=2785326 RepID=UPI0019341C65|nr:gliding motility lipoprotein GldD [Robertkochia sediminum]MBL7471970.1 gliding motility lipoprotein GldD [Robertkochia sediminum]
MIKCLSVCFAMTIAVGMVSCSDPVVPKPKAMLRLEYPEAQYETAELPCSFAFDKNTSARLVGEKDCSFVLDYDKFNASIYVTYKPVKGDLDKLLRDAQKLTYEHVVKADNITEQPFVNAEDGVYGMFYELEGNAASQSQFYLTDSVRHFITGSLYFKVKPNYDSVMPAAHYLGNDIRKVMESFYWK